MYKLVIANRNYSSWSLRAWLYLTESNIRFDEIRIPLFTDDWQSEVAKYSPAGRLPVLLDDDIAVWDTMAIIGHLLEKHPQAVGWPRSAAARAHARSIAAEMHSGFFAVRDELPQNLRARNKIDQGRLSDACRKQIVRIDHIWADCRSSYGDAGEWLFGELSIADIFYIPVALRFMTYSIEVSDLARQFVSAVQAADSVRQWIEAARVERESLPFIDELIPASSSPLTLG
jgi:glutathione S-transferase